MEAEPSRAYRHLKCGAVTVVSGKSLALICNPHLPVFGTKCMGPGCQGDILDHFEWTDTGENVEKYRLRLEAQAPSAVKLVDAGWLMLIIGTVGGVASWFAADAVGLGRTIGFMVPVLAAVVGFVVALFVWYQIKQVAIIPMLTRHIDYRIAR
mgnify:CR=1 FL=1